MKASESGVLYRVQIDLSISKCSGGGLVAQKSP